MRMRKAKRHNDPHHCHVHVCHKSVHVSVSEVCVLKVIIEVVGVGVVSSQLSGLV